MQEKIEKFISDKYCEHCPNFFTCLGYEGCSLKSLINPAIEKEFKYKVAS